MTQMQSETNQHCDQIHKANQDALINFQLTQQNGVAVWNPNLTLQQHSGIKTTSVNLHNDDDLVYSDNENESDHHNYYGSRVHTQPVQTQQKAPHKKISLTLSIHQINSNRQEGERSNKTSARSIHKTKWQKEQEGESQLRQNKSSCLLHNKSVFFTSNTKSICSTIVFRVKPRPNIKQLAGNSMKTARNNA